MSDQAILVTGAAGFIGFHVARRLLTEGLALVGLDNLNSYYDPVLKEARLDILRRQPRFAFEVQLDKLAEAIGMDPIELRRRNFLGARTRTVNELRITSNGFATASLGSRRIVWRWRD